MIYTRTGDDGYTSLPGGRRISKSSQICEIIGTLEELNVIIGVTYENFNTSLPRLRDIRAWLLEIMFDLFRLETFYSGLGSQYTDHPQIDVGELEYRIDLLDEDNSILSKAILPLGHPIAANLHHCRAVCRRLERLVTALLSSTLECQSNLDDINHLYIKEQKEHLCWLNRLSDFFFVAARTTCRLLGGIEVIHKNKRSLTE